ncbi:glyoxysomal processing protease, glyoxysomal isoform X2 [Apium graveolens]|uniref:glyoxysomal processing protease, glyoxysomal isoform X2 n=1 Tax=Apium graveolens TaxID=4045 RepID=UPI003D7C037A
MSLPEIVDFARNFAVMVRVQGPDPKSLKMRRHAFHYYNSGKTTLSASGMLLPSSLFDSAIAKQIIGDCDALLPDCAFVLTVASVIEPFLSNRDNLAQGKNTLIAGSQIDIMVEEMMGTGQGRNMVDKDAPRWLSAKLLTLVEIPVASDAVQSLIESSTGALDHGWEVGWSLSSYSSGPQPLPNTLQEHVHQSSRKNKGQRVGDESSNPSVIGKSTARIAILGVSSALVQDSSKLRISVINKKGDLLLAMGSPFGVLSPVHFFNSISVGSVANCYPAASSKSTLLMADIRCLPGTEGCPVFGENAQLIGILTRPLRQRTSGAEIQLVIPWEAIATSCSNLSKEEPQYLSKWNQTISENSNILKKKSSVNSPELDTLFHHNHEKTDSRGSPPSSVEKAMASICLITVDDGAWASGILLNKKGLVLTNAHLLEPWRFRKTTAGKKSGAKSEVIFMRSHSASPENKISYSHTKNWELLSTEVMPVDLSISDERRGYNYNIANTRRSIRVRLDNKEPWIWVIARVLYISQGPLDVALLQLDYVPEQLHPIAVDLTCPSPGSKACVIGHGLFGPRHDFFPSACLGVVAKVVTARRPLAHQSGDQENGNELIPAMIETTAAVHPGGSGGAVVNSDGHMIGLVTSNARHGGGVLIPHLNFSIPCAALEPIFKFSKDMKDISLLEDLDKPNEYISSVWALVPPLTPKPGPNLPDPPEFQSGDIAKDVKGSRFAKFMAERQEMLKKASESDKVDSSFTKFLPSKF